MTNTIWMLPEGVDELLPPEAWAMEQLRQDILGHYWRCGYGLVQPPMIEYLESLLVGTGHEFDLQTFKLVDQLNGRTLGVRADMTPQVARIDAHRLGVDCPVRLCYLGTVLRTRPDGFAGSRSPMQLGAEIYGHKGVASDAEVVSLMLETLQLAGIDNVYVDIGHVGIFRQLAEQAALDEAQTFLLFEMMQRKSRAEIESFVDTLDCNAESRSSLVELIDLNGDISVLNAAASRFNNNLVVQSAIEYLQQLCSLVLSRFPGAALNVDLAELRGYHYHSGVVFAAYQHGQGQEIARGGRYDDIGKAFGRARPATGFSTDLKSLLTSAESVGDLEQNKSVFVPVGIQSQAWDKIRALRDEGYSVICELPGQTGGAAEMRCSHILTNNNNDWHLSSVK